MKHRFLSICFRSYSFSNAVEEGNKAKMGEGLIKGIKLAHGTHRFACFGLILTLSL